MTPLQDLQQLIVEKLRDGRLPHDSIPRTWGGPGNGERCDACDEIVRKDQYIIQGVTETGHGIQTHADCFNFWNSAR